MTRTPRTGAGAARTLAAAAFVLASIFSGHIARASDGELAREVRKESTSAAGRGRTSLRTVRLRALRIDIPTELVHLTIGHRASGESCAVEPSYATALRVKRKSDPERTFRVAALLHEQLESLGMPAVPPDSGTFDVDGPSVDFGIFGSIRHLSQTLCERGGEKAVESRTRATVEWLVFDHHRQITAHVVTTRGEAHGAGPGFDTELEVEEALASAAARLAQDAGLRSLLASRRAREPAPARSADSWVTPRRAGTGNSFKEELARARDATVAVSTAFGDQSGVLIAPGYVLTHADAVVGANVRVRIGSVRHRAEVVRHDPVHRAALLRVVGAGGDASHAAVVSERTPEMGGAVYLLAASHDRSERTVSAGIVSALRMQEGSPIYQTDALCEARGIGGPVLDDRGHVVGLAIGGVRGRFGDDVGINYFLPLPGLLRALGIAPPAAADSGAAAESAL